MEFDTLNLSAPIKRAVAEKGYKQATPIQEKAIPHVIAGSDLMGCAQTGTGKTAAFALPILHRLLEQITEAAAARNADGTVDSEANGTASHAAADGRSDRGPQRGADPLDRRRGPRSAGRQASGRPTRALVLVPTRELAVQIQASFATYGKHTNLRSTVIYGGVGQGSQVRALQKGVDIVIATPGRLLDLMNQGYVQLRQVTTLVLDEADQMLDMGFIHDLKRIVSTVPDGRQTLMFSATMSDEIRALSREWLDNPVLVEVVPVATPAERVTQAIFFVEPADKPTLLTHFLRTHQCGRTLVFSRTKHGADKIVKRLLHEGISAAAIHSNKSQSVRQKTLERFKSQRPMVLIATDIAARGLDVGGITHVFNYDLPDVPEVYVHRIGRTGRAGAEGIAYSFCSRDERSRLRMIERVTRLSIPVGQPDEAIAGLCQQAPRRRDDSDTSGGESSSTSYGGRPQRRGGSGGGSSGGQRYQGSSGGGRPRGKFGNKPSSSGRGYQSRSAGKTPASGTDSSAEFASAKRPAAANSSYAEQSPPRQKKHPGSFGSGIHKELADNAGPRKESAYKPAYKEADGSGARSESRGAKSSGGGYKGGAQRKFSKGKGKPRPAQGNAPAESGSSFGKSTFRAAGSSTPKAAGADGAAKPRRKKRKFAAGGQGR